MNNPHIIATNSGVDYEKEVNQATKEKLYIPVVIDEQSQRHRLEQLGCRRAQQALETAAKVREEVLAKIAAEEKATAEAKQQSVDEAVLASAKVAA